MLPNNLRELCLEIVLFNEKCCCTHCYWHALNLAIGDAIRSARFLATVFDAARDICKLMELSPITNSAKLSILLLNCLQIDFSRAYSSFP